MADFSTVSRRQKQLSVAIKARPTRTGLHLLVDNTGIKMLGEGEWKTKKHGADYRRQWRKVHLGIDAAPLENRTIEVTDNSIGDAPIPRILAPRFSGTRRAASISFVWGMGRYDQRLFMQQSRYPCR